MKFSADSFKKLVLLSIFFSSSIFAKSSLQVTTIEDFQKWVEARILCQKTPYQTKENDKDFAKKMKALGFKAKINLGDESGIYDGRVMIQKPIMVYGMKLKEISFYMDSGIGFYALIEAPPDDLVKLVKDKKLNKYLSKQNTDDSPYTFLTSKPDADGLAPEGIVINKGQNKKITEIGCQQFDY